MHRFLLPVCLLAAPAALQAQDCFNLNLGTNLGLIDDSTAQGLSLGFTFNFGGVAYTDICVCSNGFIWLGPTSVAGGDYTPTEAELLSGAPRICPLWTDFNPSAVGSGKVYYTLLHARRERQLDNVALVRVEQLHPFPHQELKSILGGYPNAQQLYWVQEEPQNMGGWTYMEPRLRRLSPDGAVPTYIGRDAAASPATGSYKVHQAEEAEFVARAFAR